MLLVKMVSEDEDSLICDFAQYYHILDYRELGLNKAVILASGLPPESRIMKKLMDQKYDINTMLLANIADSMALNVWTKTKDAAKNRNRPQSITKALTQSKEKEAKAFSSPAEFEAEWKRLAHGA